MSLIRYDLDGGAARIILTAPDRGNPLDPDMAAELFRAVRRARADDARVVVLRSEGRAFSFGGDVGAFATADDREQMVDDLAETLHRTISDLHRMDAVVVSAVQGMAAGAGVPLAAAADVVLAGASARFTLAYTKIGLSPDGGSSLLTASLGLHRALHLALLNPILTAQQAQAPFGWLPGAYVLRGRPGVRRAEESQLRPVRVAHRGSVFGAGEGRRTLADECVHALATVWAGGAGADGQRLAAQRALSPGRGGLAEQPFGGDLRGARPGEQLGDDKVDRGVELVVGMDLGDQTRGLRLLSGQDGVEQRQVQRPVQPERRGEQRAAAVR